MSGDDDRRRAIRLRRGFWSAVVSFPAVGGTALMPQVAVVFLPPVLAAWNPYVGLSVGAVLMAMLVPAICWKAEVSDHELRCSTLGFELLRVDLRNTNGVCRQLVTGSTVVSRVIVLDAPAVTFRRFGHSTPSRIDLDLANCMGPQRERVWLQELGSRTKRGYLGRIGSDGVLHQDEFIKIVRPDLAGRRRPGG